MTTAYSCTLSLRLTAAACSCTLASGHFATGLQLLAAATASRYNRLSFHSATGLRLHTRCACALSSACAATTAGVCVFLNAVAGDSLATKYRLLCLFSPRPSNPCCLNASCQQRPAMTGGGDSLVCIPHLFASESGHKQLDGLVAGLDAGRHRLCDLLGRLRERAVQASGPVRLQRILCDAQS